MHNALWTVSWMHILLGIYYGYGKEYHEDSIHPIVFAHPPFLTLLNPTISGWVTRLICPDFILILSEFYPQIKPDPANSLGCAILKHQCLLTSTPDTTKWSPFVSCDQIILYEIFMTYDKYQYGNGKFYSLSFWDWFWILWTYQRRKWSEKLFV